MIGEAPITLLELNKIIKKLIKQGLESYWLIAEINELKVNYNGHCYLEFIQKEENTEKIVSRARATIWSTTFRMIKPYFETTTGKPFSEGIKIMVRVRADFHEIYGLSLNVIDIEPTYTVGEAAVRRQKIIEKLMDEGIFDMNHELEMPYFTQKLAIISSPTAAGLEDFIDQVTNNQQGFKFYFKLFPAVMQGNEAEGSIIRQLDKINRHIQHFDVVVIIRGGGAQADLDCFNNYWLAYNIAQFPIPVITGIGHEQDDSVVDMVAHTRLKTPTAVAEYLISRFVYLAEDLRDIQENIVETCRQTIEADKHLLLKKAHKLQQMIAEKLKSENQKLSGFQSRFISNLQSELYNHRKALIKTTSSLEQKSLYRIHKEENKLHHTSIAFQNKLKSKINRLKFDLELIENSIQLNDPSVVLQKGYTITTHNGKIIMDAADLTTGDSIETRFHKGKHKSIIQ
jgi:exodeoxyribonuclease VII large subunit